MKIMHIDASARLEGSVSRKLSNRLVDHLRKAGAVTDLDRLDLAQSPLAHFGQMQAAAMYLPAASHDAGLRDAISASDALCARVLAADALVIGTPIYNFGMPSTLKAFLDHIVRSGITYVADETGFRGLLAGKRVACIATFGGDYDPGGTFEGMDHLSPHLKTVLGFLGVTDPDFVLVHPTLIAAPDRLDTVRARAEAEVDQLAAAWSA